MLSQGLNMGSPLARQTPYPLYCHSFLVQIIFIYSFLSWQQHLNDGNKIIMLACCKKFLPVQLCLNKVPTFKQNWVWIVVFFSIIITLVNIIAVSVILLVLLFALDIHLICIQFLGMTQCSECSSDGDLNNYRVPVITPERIGCKATALNFLFWLANSFA